MDSKHRKTIRHIHEPGHVHELTFSCFDRLPLLAREERLRVLAESITRATMRHQFRLLAFVFMPEHVHLLVLPERTGSTIPELLKAIKRPCSYRMKQLLTEAGDPLLDRLTVRQRPGTMTFRFWQEGPGYDRNITDPGTLQAAVDYVHMNPVKRRLCERAVDWKWSSARFHLLPGMVQESDLPVLSPVPADWLQ